jgi:hypothetical protein
MAVAHHLLPDLRYGDGALYACLVVLVLLLGSRVYYLKHLSVWLDIRILFETVRTIVAGHRPVQAELPEPQ